MARLKKIQKNTDTRQQRSPTYTNDGERNKKYPLFYIDIVTKEDNKKVYKINKIADFQVKIEPPKNIKRDPTMWQLLTVMTYKKLLQQSTKMREVRRKSTFECVQQTM